MRRVTALLGCLLLLLPLALSAQALPYTDAGSIRNGDAVAMLTDLALLEGDESLAFHPADALTRAEVAKLAALIITPEPVATQPAPFVDIAGHWAEDYISFCYEYGFLAGYDDGTFAPDEPVTAQELVKMLLGATGYDLSGLSGAGWGEQLDALADELRVYNGYELDCTQPLSRDYAARLILNVLNCTAVEGYDDDGQPVYLVDDLLNPVSVLEHRFGVTRYQQVITANEYADLANGETLDEGYTKLYGHYPMAFSTPLSALGRTVTVYLRDGQLVGVPVYDPEEFCVTVTGQESLDALLLQGGYFLAEDALLYDNAQPADTAALDDLADTDTVTLIDYESDGAIDLVLIYRWVSCPVLQSDPLVIETPEGNQVFSGTAWDGDEALALALYGRWVLNPF